MLEEWLVLAASSMAIYSKNIHLGWNLPQSTTLTKVYQALSLAFLLTRLATGPGHCLQRPAATPAAGRGKESCEWLLYPAISMKDSDYEPVKSDHQIIKREAWEQRTVSKPSFGHSFRWQALLVASSMACGNQGIEKEAELLGRSICYTPLPYWPYCSMFHGLASSPVNNRRFRLFPGAELDWHELFSRIWNSRTW